MSLTLLISNIYKRLYIRTAALTTGLTTVTVEQQPHNNPSNAVRKPKGGRKPIEFNIVEAMHLRRQGWSYRRIAWKMHVATMTVRARLIALESASLPLPVQAPVPVLSPIQQAPATVQNPRESPPVAPKPSALPVAAPKPLATPVLVQQAPTPAQSPSNALAQPIDNAEELIRRHPWLVEVDQSWRTQIFLVNSANPLNLQYASNNGQHCVALTRWHEDYRRLAVFKDAKHIWVVLDPNDDNDAFLGSIVSDIWLREKCLVARVDSVLDVTKYKTTNHKMFVGTFEHVFKFVACPQPNHTAVIAKLLEKPPAKPAQFSQPSFGGLEPWMPGGCGYAPSADWKPKLGGGGNPDGNDGSGCCM